MKIEIKKDKLGFRSQLGTFCNGLDSAMVTLLNLDSAKVTKLKKTRLLIEFIFDQENAAHDYSQNMNTYGRLLFQGIGNEILGPIPVPPVNPGTLPDVTEANAYGQMADLIADCKRSPNFTSNVASGLGVLAPGSDFDPAVNSPIVRLSLTVNGHPAFHLKNKMEYQGFEIWKLVQNAGPVPPPPPTPTDSGFRKLERVFGVDFVDPEALPVFGQSQVWFYKYFYLLKNQQAGIGSAVFSINVSGVV
jgi:hypothetical protein